MKDESHPKEEEKNTGNHASKASLKGQHKDKPAKAEKKPSGKKNGPGG